MGNIVQRGQRVCWWGIFYREDKGFVGGEYTTERTKGLFVGNIFYREDKGFVGEEYTTVRSKSLLVGNIPQRGQRVSWWGIYYREDKGFVCGEYILQRGQRVCWWGIYYREDKGFVGVDEQSRTSREAGEGSC